jgi:hypothetical protein
VVFSHLHLHLIHGLQAKFTVLTSDIHSRPKDYNRRTLEYEAIPLHSLTRQHTQSWPSKAGSTSTDPSDLADLIELQNAVTRRQLVCPTSKTVVTGITHLVVGL